MAFRNKRCPIFAHQVVRHGDHGSIQHNRISGGLSYGLDPFHHLGSAPSVITKYEYGSQ